MNETFDTIIVAAGSGRRLGYNIPKAFVELGGKPMLIYSVETFLTHPLSSHIILVVPEELVETTQDKFDKKSVSVVAGGNERWQSVYNGCTKLRSDWVLIHDAARPFVTIQGIDALLGKRNSFQCAISAIPVVDTIRMFENDIAGQTVDRSKLIRVGTPQMFATHLLRKAFSTPIKCTTPPTDEAVLMQNMGISVGIAQGDPKNFKITTREDLEIAEALVKNLPGLHHI